MTQKNNDVDLLKGSPVGPRLIIYLLDFEEQDKKAKTSDVQLYIPETAKRNMAFNGRIGKVVKMGLDCYNDVFQSRVGAIKPWCKVGDIVGIKSHASLFVEDSAKGYVSITDQDIIHNFSDDTLSN